MDEIVLAALRKWPAVPACHGWLALDVRGDWYLRDDRTQAAGPFPAVKGSVLRHAGLCAFIARNYQCDPTGDWYFQNGPQQVYVELEAAPLVLGVQRLDGGWEVSAAQLADADALAVRGAWLDEHGRLFLDTGRGYGLVRSLDMASAADALEAGVWPLQQLAFEEMPQRFGYRLSPQREAGR
jgi:hypothetical protein